MRGPVGQHWTRALQKDSALKTAYDNCGKGYESQRRFRAQWAAEKYEYLTRSRVHKQSFDTSSGMEAEYLPFNVIVQREGSGVEGQRAARNLVQTCYALHKQGKTQGPDKKPYVTFNYFTKRVEYLR
eukprot:9694688-Alexandrium_andersonii.AAC.1